MQLITEEVPGSMTIRPIVNLGSRKLVQVFWVWEWCLGRFADFKKLTNATPFILSF